jgi:7-carboxy-7-deazaguanine synthase
VSLIVNEIFYSIQGESSFAGRPCVFIRLTGCNLRCDYCDTQYAYHEGDELDIAGILDKIAAYKCPLVEVTGGEPLIQKDTPALIYSLLEEGYEVLLETNGSLATAEIDKRCVKIIDIKCPSSGEHEKCDPDILASLSDKDEVKFVVGDRKDYEYAKEMLAIMRRKPLSRNTAHFSPVFEKMDPRVLAEWILEDHLDAELNLQIHKFIWDPERRGV